MLDENGVTSQVSMNYGGVTGVKVTEETTPEKCESHATGGGHSTVSRDAKTFPLPARSEVHNVTHKK